MPEQQDATEDHRLAVMLNLMLLITALAAAITLPLAKVAPHPVSAFLTWGLVAFWVGEGFTALIAYLCWNRDALVNLVWNNTSSKPQPPAGPRELQAHLRELWATNISPAQARHLQHVVALSGFATTMSAQQRALHIFRADDGCWSILPLVTDQPSEEKHPAYVAESI